MARQQRLAIRWGAGAAVAMRIVLTGFAVALLALPWLKLAGAVLLLWIGVRLLAPGGNAGDVRAGARASWPRSAPSSWPMP